MTYRFGRLEPESNITQVLRQINRPDRSKVVVHEGNEPQYKEDRVISRAINAANEGFSNIEFNRGYHAGCAQGITVGLAIGAIAIGILSWTFYG